MNEDKIYKHLRTERLDITEADGTLKLSLFNGTNVAPLMMDGVDLLPGHRQGQGIAGMIFYNSQGDECGGMSLTSQRTAEGIYQAGLSMTFDQYKQDQVLQMIMQIQGDQSMYGFRVYDRPETHIKETVAAVLTMRASDDPTEKERIMAPIRAKSNLRLMIGKQHDGSVGLHIYDQDGRVRIRISLDAEDNPHLEMLDASGTVVATLV